MTPQEIIDDLIEAAQPDFGCDNAEANAALEPFIQAQAKIEALLKERLEAERKRCIGIAKVHDCEAWTGCCGDIIAEAIEAQ